MAGSRASKDPKIYRSVRRLLQMVITAYLPKKLEDSVERLMSQVPLKDRVSIASMPESDLLLLNDTFGDYIRRKFGLLSGNGKLLASCCLKSGKKDLTPEEASGVIIKDFWDSLRETHKIRPVK